MGYYNLTQERDGVIVNIKVTVTSLKSPGEFVFGILQPDSDENGCAGTNRKLFLNEKGR